MINYILSLFKKKEEKLKTTKPVYQISLEDYEKLDVRQQIILHSKYDVIQKPSR